VLNVRRRRTEDRQRVMLVVTRKQRRGGRRHGVVSHSQWWGTSGEVFHHSAKSPHPRPLPEGEGVDQGNRSLSRLRERAGVRVNTRDGVDADSLPAAFNTPAEVGELTRRQAASCNQCELPASRRGPGS
jgi:hypothetical protein